MNTTQTMVRGVRCLINSHKLLNRSGHSGGNSNLNLYFTDRHIKQGLGIHDSSRQGYRVQGVWGQGRHES